MDRPIMVCGAPGSGTSFATKVLRLSGVFVGSDAGPVDARKYHESVCFRDANNILLNSTIAFPHAPKGAEQFRTHVEKLQQQLEHYSALIDVAALLRTYWGEQAQTKLWGWKDPRNSANALVWRNLFPNLRVLIVKKAWRSSEKRKLGTLAGTWFRTSSDQAIRELYVKPPFIDGLDVHYLDFDRLLTDAFELDMLWDWLGVDPASLPSHPEFMQIAGVE